jgi:N-alpha-acetyltransferase 10/11
MAGFIAGDMRSADGIGWITTLGVAPAYRRLGIAMALLEDCEKQMDVSRIHLCVRKSNLPAINLYNKLGYHQIDVWRAYYSDKEDAFVLEKLVDKHVDSVSNKRYTDVGD